MMTSYCSFDFIAYISEVESLYQSALTTQSSIFIRPNGDATQYYFEAIEVTAPLSGKYTIVADSGIDTYGCLYRKPFNPTSPLLNLIQTDDDNGPGRNFNLTVNLTADQSVIVVGTTYSALQTTSFNITVYGPSQVTVKCMSRFL